MSKLEEKNQAIALLSDKLRMLGLIKLHAADNVLRELGKTSISSAVVDDVRLILETALDKQKEKIRKAIDKL